MVRNLPTPNWIDRLSGPGSRESSKPRGLIGSFPRTSRSKTVWSWRGPGDHFTSSRTAVATPPATCSRTCRTKESCSAVTSRFVDSMPRSAMVGQRGGFPSFEGWSDWARGPSCPATDPRARGASSRTPGTTSPRSTGSPARHSATRPPLGNSRGSRSHSGSADGDSPSSFRRTSFERTDWHGWVSRAIRSAESSHVRGAMGIAPTISGRYPTGIPNQPSGNLYNGRNPLTLALTHAFCSQTTHRDPPFAPRVLAGDLCFVTCFDTLRGPRTPSDTQRESCARCHTVSGRRHSAQTYTILPGPRPSYRGHGSCCDQSPIGVQLGARPDGNWRFWSRSGGQSVHVQHDRVSRELFLAKPQHEQRGDTSFSDQLNVVLEFAQGGSTYAYWIQDVAFMDSATGDLGFENNIWNFSSGSYCLSNSALSGNGTVYPISGCEGYYAVGASSQPGANEVMPSPGDFSLLVRSYFSGGGLPEVAFEYWDGVTSYEVTY